MKENEILEYRKQVYEATITKVKEEFSLIPEDDLDANTEYWNTHRNKFRLCLDTISQHIILEQDEQIKSKEREAAYRIIRADIIKNAKDDQIKEARMYVPIPMSSYKDIDQERRTRPEGEDAESKRVSTKTIKGDKEISKPRQSSEEKNVGAIARALGLTEEAAKIWLEAQKIRATSNQGETNGHSNESERAS